jgi:uncharacterized RDD family membrane protein YckC
VSQQPPVGPGPQDRPYASPPTSPYPPPPPSGYAPSPQGYASPPPAGYADAPGPAYAYAPSPQYQPPAYSPYATEYYAPWASRVGAYLLDYVLILPGWLLAVIGVIVSGSGTSTRGRGSTAPTTLGVVLAIVGYALMIGLTIWNRWIRAGRTGQSWGKRVLKIRLVRESDGQPIGAGMAFLRDLAHIVDGFFYLGYLWPLWDAKRQTFADKICSTVVLARPTR